MIWKLLVNSIPEILFNIIPISLSHIVILTNRGNPSVIFSELKRIGKGSFGEVFLGKDSRLNPQRPVAIKKMGITPRNTKYLIAEISVQQNSKHPNIVEFIGSWLLDIELWVNQTTNLQFKFCFILVFCVFFVLGCNGIYAKWRFGNFIGGKG